MPGRFRDQEITTHAYRNQSVTTDKIADTAVTAAKIPLNGITSAVMAESLLKSETVSVTADELAGMYTTPKELVADPGAGRVLVFLGAVLVYDYAGAGFGAGGDITIRYGTSGTIVSNTVSAANSIGATADKIVDMVPLDSANGIVLTANKPLVLTNATQAFTKGSATGVVRMQISYRVLTTGL